MVICPIENKRGGVAQAKKVWVIRNGVFEKSNTIIPYTYTWAEGNTGNVGSLSSSQQSGYIRITDVGSGTWVTSNGTLYFKNPITCNGGILHIKLNVNGANTSGGHYVRIGTTDSEPSGYYTYSTYAEINSPRDTTYEVTMGVNNNFWVVASFVCYFSGSINIDIYDMWLEPYPTRLSDGELYAYGLGADKWDNSGYTDSQLTNKIATINSKYISIDSSSGYMAQIGTLNKINFTEYKKLCVTTEIVKSTNSSSGFVNLCTTKAEHARSGEYKYAKISGSVGNVVTTELDTTSVSGEYYISFYATDSRGFNIKKVWLEK